MTPDSETEYPQSRKNKGRVRTAILALIRLYQRTVSRLLPPSCRFYPSCSEYTWQAVWRYGLWRGGWMACRRLARCHPFNPGGYDPVL